MMDIEKMHGTCEISQINGDMAVLVGSAPVVTMRNYQKEVVAYTKGLGRLFCSFKGYEPCHNAQEVIERIGYDSEGMWKSHRFRILRQWCQFFVSWMK